MKKLLTIAAVLISFAASAQKYQDMPNYGIGYARIYADSALYIPDYNDTLPHDATVNRNRAQVRIFQGELWYKPKNGYWKKGVSGNGGSVDLSNYYNKQQAEAVFQFQGDYLTGADLAAYETKSHANSVFATIGSLNDYLLSADTANKWQPKGNYLTAITNSNVITALGFTPYNSTNPNGYITSTALTPLAIKTEVDSAKNNLRAQIANKPDSIDLIVDATITGVGTDLDPLRVDTNVIATKNALALKQDKLIPGTTLKTINGNNLLGTGDIAITGGGTSVTITDNLTTSTAGTALDAHQGNVLKGLIDNHTTAIAGKQDALVSGTNIKTINGSPITGSGDLTIAGGSSFSGVTQTIEATQQVYPYMGYTVNTNKKIGYQFFDNGDGTISIQVAFITNTTPDKAIKSTQGDIIKSSQGDIIIYN
jgi:hypothetical protein